MSWRPLRTRIRRRILLARSWILCLRTHRGALHIVCCLLIQEQVVCALMAGLLRWILTLTMHALFSVQRQYRQIPRRGTG
jgi:hypothetical protein